jgi:hypothetical protein
MPYFRIYNRKLRRRDKKLVTNHPFFAQEVVVKIKHDSMIFYRPTLDGTARTQKPHFGSGSYRLSIASEDIEAGEWTMDEDESNEDRIVLYYD